MPRKDPDTIRQGGPGASHEDRSEGLPKKAKGSPDRPDRLDEKSRVSGGGGEADSHHTHDPVKKGGR
jgi:hypothetical protein